MLLITHIVIALISVFYSTYLYFSPSSNKLKAAYTLVGVTVASGTVLVVRAHAPLVQSCMTGLVFIGVSLSGIILATRKLATEKQK